MRSSWIEVDLDALRNNAKYVKSRIAPGAKFLAAVKGNAYGFGAVPCARVFAEQGADYLGVAIAEEGKELRENGIKLPILIFGATFSDDYDLLFDYDLIPNVFTVEAACELSKMAAERKTTLKIHLSVDTGLSRLGFILDDELADKIEKIYKLPNLEVEGLFTMLAAGELYPEDKYCYWQFDRFQKLYDELKSRGVNIPMRHMCDSGATIARPEFHLEMVRPGSALYGMICGDNFFGDIQSDHMKEAMTIKSRIAVVRPVKKGTYAGYGLAWQAEKDSVLAVIPMGYVDGISRIASNRGNVLVHGVKCPIIGKVCMDQTTIDVSAVPDVKIGDEVVVLGKQDGNYIDMLEAGDYAGTSDTEFTCRVGRRLPVYYVGEKAEEYAGDAALSRVLKK